MEILKTITAVLNLAFGLYSLLQPEQLASASGLRLASPRGRAEIRISFGGFFIGFGAAALLLNDPEAYRLLGIGYLLAAATRLLQLAMENSAIADRSFIVLLVIESVVGLILIL